jgi:hypothetical protein
MRHTHLPRTFQTNHCSFLLISYSYFSNKERGRIRITARVPRPSLCNEVLKLVPNKGGKADPGAMRNHQFSSYSRAILSSMIDNIIVIHVHAWEFMRIHQDLQESTGIHQRSMRDIDIFEDVFTSL